MIELHRADTRTQRTVRYAEILGTAAELGPTHEHEAKRWLATHDLFFLLVALLRRKDLNHDWLFARCQEVQHAPDGHLDLWAREHGKTSIISFGKTIQDVLIDPEVTIGLFSHTRPMAKRILRQIMREFERNTTLKALFPEILWDDPAKEAPTWSEDNGLVVKRAGNPSEATIEAWGMVDGLPTGKHFALRVYDDVIDKKAVNTPEQIAKVTEMWELSLALGTRGGRARYIGTRYHTNDTYREILKRGSAKPRVYPATVDGTPDGEPVFMTRAELATRRRDWGVFTFAAQMLQNPTADSKQGFQVSWLRSYVGHNDGKGMTKYLLVDPASEKKKSSDYTAMAVIGLASDRNYYLLDAIRDRLNPSERRDALFALHRRWRPNGVGYEKYGASTDIAHIDDKQVDENYRFDITPLGGQMSKPDRIKRMVPIFEAGRFYLPEVLIKTDYEGRAVDIVQSFIEEEFKPFPVAVHDDLLDIISRILDSDLNVLWPKSAPPEEDRYAKRRPTRRRLSHWAA